MNASLKTFGWSGSLTACLLAVLPLSCGGAQQAASPGPPGPGSVFGGETCKAVRNPREPKLTAWDPEERAQINAVRRNGVVAVRYALSGCNVELEVLPDCLADGSYDFTPTPSVKQDYVENQQDLFAELPLGAASLSGKLQGNQVLRTDYTLIGVAALAPGLTFSRASLHGVDCERATHVIARVYMGGFAMAAGEAQTLKAEVSLFGAGAGGTNTSKFERVYADGNAKACARALESGKEDPLCSVALRIGLLALPESSKCPSGSDWDGQKCVAAALPTKPAVIQKCASGMQLREGKCSPTPPFSGPLSQGLSGIAKADYEAGKIAFNDGDFHGASIKFMAAYEASHDPRLLWNAAASEKNLRRYHRVEALVQRYVFESGDQLAEQDKAEANALLGAVGAFVSDVKFEVQAGTTVTIDDETIGVTPLANPVRLSIGEHKIRLEKSGFQPYLTAIGVAGGGTEIVKATLRAGAGH